MLVHLSSAWFVSLMMDFTECENISGQIFADSIVYHYSPNK